jgi:transglutaminase-like putative cysteine protease
MRLRISHLTSYPGYHPHLHSGGAQSSHSRAIYRRLFFRDDGITEQKAGHAWAEACVPELGWVAFDAANGICGTDAHVRVAAGLDYLGAAPLRGAHYGGRGEALSVQVRVTQAAHQAQN